MRILIVAATDTEIAPLLERMISLPTGDLSVDCYSRGSHEIDVLITGVGMVATAAWCSRALAQTPYDLALNLGVCGSFDSFIEPGTVVHVVKDRLAELGAEDGDQFRTIEDLQLPGQAEFVNFDPPSNPGIEQLPSVAGITVNSVHGNERSIALVTGRFNPQVESMEGAAFMFACRLSGVPYAQVRAVSNAIERRNRGQWKVPEAIDALATAARTILETV